MRGKLVWRHAEVPFLSLQRGFSLLELVMTLALAATLSMAGVSSFQHLVASNKVDTLMWTLRTSLALARSEAINRGQRVVLCRQSVSPGQCAGSTQTGKAVWSQGWLVFVDKDNDRLLDTDKGDELLRVFQPLDSVQRLMWNNGDFIAYDGSGALGSRNGTFCVGHSSGATELQRELVLMYTGRLRTAATTCRYPLVL